MKLLRSAAGHGEDTLIKETTDSIGRFLSFPDVPPWSVGKISRPVLAAGKFRCRHRPFRDGLAYLRWIVQPDGFYYTDEDGFSAEEDEEI